MTTITPIRSHRRTGHWRRRTPFGDRRAPRAIVEVVLAAGALAVLAMWWVDTSGASVGGPGGWLTAVGRVAGLLAGYLALVEILLLARLTWLDRAVGFDRLVRWHRVLGASFVALVLLHVFAVIWGYGTTARRPFLSEAAAVITSGPGMLEATAAMVVLVAVGLASAGAARRRLSDQAWYGLHLLTYAAVASAFFHQTSTGADFVGHPVDRIVWSVMYAAVAATVLAWRIVLPCRDWLRYRMTVERVVDEAEGVVSIWVRGSGLGRLGASAGQFLLCRFAAPGLLLAGRPLALSAVPTGSRLRVTVRADGDRLRDLRRLRPGTPVFAEGPFGTLVVRRRIRSDVLLIAGGLGVGPIRALAEELTSRRGAPRDVTVIYRAGAVAALALWQELEELSRRRGVLVHYVTGHRVDLGHDPLAPRNLLRLVPDIAFREIVVCGPAGMVEATVAGLRLVGLPHRRIHTQSLPLW